MKICFADTETTGFIRKDVDHLHPAQVRVVQLGYIIVDTDNSSDDHFRGGMFRGKEFNRVIKPEGWVVPEQAAAIHGFTTERALQFGLPRAEVFGEFAYETAECELFVFHNEAYDNPVLAIESRRGDFVWNPKSVFCTMEATTPICRLPGRFGKYKWPKMQEAFKHFFGYEFEGAHDAMADVRACRDVFFQVRPEFIRQKLAQ